MEIVAMDMKVLIQWSFISMLVFIFFLSSPCSVKRNVYRSSVELCGSVVFH